MQTTIGDFDAATSQVEVTFEGTDSAGASISFKRPVNACLTNGSYDAAATQARVDEVALGVQVKMTLGVIRADQLNPAPEAEPAAH